MWVCECGKALESRTKYLLHKGRCKTEDVNPKKCDLQDCCFQLNLQEGACALPNYEESFSDLIPNIEREFPVESEITIAKNVNDTQMSDLLFPAELTPIVLPENRITCNQRDVLPEIDETWHDVNISLEEQCIVDNTAELTPIALPENRIKCNQRDVLPSIDETRHHVNISLEEQFTVDNTVTISTENCEKHPDNISSFVEKPTRPTEFNELVSDTLCDIPQDWLENEDIDDSDADPDWSPTDDQPRKRKTALLCLQINKRRKIQTVSDIADTEDSDDSDEQVSVAADTGNRENTTVSSESGRVLTHTNTISGSSQIKRKKGIRTREEEKRKKDQGLSYKTRSGKVKPPILFQPILVCCKKYKCYDLVNPEIQREIFNNFYSLPLKVRDQTLCERMTIESTKTHSTGRGKSNTTHNRVVTVSYFLNIDGKKLSVCKTMFMRLYGITRGKVDYLVEKLRASTFGVIDPDMRGKNLPVNKTSEDEINAINEFINTYPRHESHYARRDSSSKKIFLPSHLTVKTMYTEYLEMRVKNGNDKSACYDVFRRIFNATGYKFKQPYIDTCKTCDAFNVTKRHTVSQNERDKIDESYRAHIVDAQEGYDRKRDDKANAATTDYQRVLVFDLQQVLPVPFLTTNIAYYKRLLSMYNLTIRDCSSNDSSECYMWSELDGGRGSEQIGSCILKKILELPDSIEQIITYSDTCGGQKRNINIAVMFMFALSQKENLKIIDQKFLLPGHTRLECDSDHARIERSKKRLGSSGSSTSKDENLKIMIPRDWCQFVRSVTGKKRFKVVEMTYKDFKAFSTLLKNVLVHRTVDSEKNPVNWHSIKWLRYTKNDFGIVYFKYDLNPFSPFRTLNLIRDRKGRKISTENLNVPNSYSKQLGVNPKKKKDLLSMLDLIDKQFHSFYKNLPTSARGREFDELGAEDSESECEGA